MAKTAQIVLGEKYRDRISGWEGVAVAQYTYLNGCIRYALGAHDKDGRPEEFVFDEQQLEVVEAPKVVTEVRRTGGDRSSSPVAR